MKEVEGDRVNSEPVGNGIGVGMAIGASPDLVMDNLAIGDALSPSGSREADDRQTPDDREAAAEPAKDDWRKMVDIHQIACYYNGPIPRS